MDEIRSAWMGLKNHWYIPPSGEKMSAKLGYDFLRCTIATGLRIFLRLRIKGVANIPKKGPTILAANHLSHVDPIAVIISSRRKSHYLAKDAHFKNIFLRTFMNVTGMIETNRETGGTEALSRAVDVLEKNRALGIFPEGTRSKKDEPPFLLPGKTGIARLSASYPDVPVVPIAINGTREMMKPNKHKLPRMWKKISLSYGKPITWMEWLSENYSVEDLLALADKDDEAIKNKLSEMFRNFTDQFMELLKSQGAP